MPKKLPIYLQNDFGPVRIYRNHLTSILETFEKAVREFTITSGGYDYDNPNDFLGSAKGNIYDFTIESYGPSIRLSITKSGGRFRAIEDDIASISVQAKLNIIMERSKNRNVGFIQKISYFALGLIMISLQLSLPYYFPDLGIINASVIAGLLCFLILFSLVRFLLRIEHYGSYVDVEHEIKPSAISSTNVYSILFEILKIGSAAVAGALATRWLSS